MHESSLRHLLTDEEERRFKNDGYLIVPDALTAAHCDRLEEASDTLDARERRTGQVADDARLSVMNFIGRDREFLDLVDCPTILPKVWGLMGWNIQIYHSHQVYTPPEHNLASEKQGWHQDSGRLNVEMEYHPRPMLSLKVAYFLSDCLADGMGNFYVVPGSQEDDSLVARDQRQIDPLGATPIFAKRGDAVLFDRRLWHTASPNGSNVTRKVLFYGYSFRWIRPRDDMSIDHFLRDCDPIRRQLLGAKVTERGYSSPEPDDVPLKEWMEQNELAADLARWG